MRTWKFPNKVVWHTLICSQCKKVINRLKLPGIVKQTSYRICNECTVGATAKSNSSTPEQAN